MDSQCSERTLEAIARQAQRNRVGAMKTCRGGNACFLMSLFYVVDPQILRSPNGTLHVVGITLLVGSVSPSSQDSIATTE